MSIDAKQVYQTHLDICSAAYLEEDYPTLLRHLSVPAYMNSSDHERWVESAEELEECLRAAREYLRKVRVEQYIRVCRDATFEGKSRTRIVGEHDTFILSGNKSVIPPYRSIMTLVLDNGEWTARGIASDVHSLDYSMFSTRVMEQFTEKAGVPPRRRSSRK